MGTVTVSSRYRITIPREVRERLRLVPGQKLRAFERDGSLVLVPVRDVRAMRGFLPGLDTRVVREKDRV